MFVFNPKLLNKTLEPFLSRKITYKQLRPLTSKLLVKLRNVLPLLMHKERISVLDLYSGTGSFIGIIEDLFDPELKVAVEKNRLLCEKLKKNFFNLKVICCDATKLIFKSQFDIVFVDPPFKFINALKQTVINIMKRNLLAEQGLLIIRTTVNHDIKFLLEIEQLEAIQDLNQGANLIRILRFKEKI